MLRVAVTPVRELSAAERGLLPAAELDREFGSGQRRREFRCGRALLRLLLERRTSLPAASHRLQIAANGKPACPGGPAIGISHGGGLVACAIADPGAIGVDVEPVVAGRDVGRVAKRFFSADESAWLESRPAEDFYGLWVLKEAYLKALGGSVFGDVNRLRCTLEPPRIQVFGEAGRSPANLRLYAADGYRLALASTAAMPDELRIEYWSKGSSGFEPDPEFRLCAVS